MYRWWKNVSIAKKLYFVVGIMAFLIVGELVTLRFAMRQLSAARAFVGGESLWSKAQKNAVFSLQRYGITKNEKDYEAYLDYLKVPEGDHRARVGLMKKDLDVEEVRAGFLQGQIHTDDIMPIIQLLRRFYWISYLQRAINTWSQGDDLLFKLEDAGREYHAAIVAGDQAKAVAVSGQIKTINEDLTVLERDFSYVLGEGSRWLEHMVLSILTLAVLTVESVGLTLAFLTSRSISRGLDDLNEAADRIGRGDFTRPVTIQSTDEIGKLGQVVNRMGGMLQKSYGELESRVQERTAELASLASENKELYERAKAAVQARDEFLSIASHELKTPLTSLYLQLQRLARGTEKLGPEAKKFEEMAHISLEQAKRISTLLEELLDLTRLGAGKFELHKKSCDLVLIVSDVVSQMTAEAARLGSVISINAEGPVVDEFDSTRVGQVVTNLTSNAIKYGRGKPISLTVERRDGRSIIRVRDGGAGIAPEQQKRIFERFERAEADPNISGLGLGLYITRQIVLAHGGMISVESDLNKGATFTVVL